MTKPAAFTGSKHGHALRGKATRTYRIWCNMLSRCTNANLPCYERYGGRGIMVCERWSNFANFLADMGEAPPGRTLDRVDNDGGYELGNCRGPHHGSRTKTVVALAGS